MKKLKIYTGPAGSYYFFKEQVLESVKKNKPDFLYILPVNRAVRQFKKDLIAAAPSQILIDPPVYTFDSFLSFCFKFIQPRKQVISGEMFQLFVEDILEKKHDFEYLPVQKNTISGSVLRIASVLGELRRYGYNKEKWQKIDCSLYHISEVKHRDFLFLLQEFEERLSTNFIDEPFAMHQAASLIREENFKELWPEVKTVFINGYELLTPAMIESIKKIRRWIDVKIKIDHLSGNRDLFRQTEPLIEIFKEMEAEFSESPATGLSERLFNRDCLAGSVMEIKNTIGIIEAENREREVEKIAAKIRDLHYCRQTKPSLIAVTFSDLDRYAPFIRKIFGQFGITYNLSTGYPLSQSPIIQKYLTILDLVCGGFPVQQVFRFIFSFEDFKNPDAHLMELYRLIVEKRLERLRPGWHTEVEEIINRSSHRNDQDKKLLSTVVRALNDRLQPLYHISTSVSISDFREQYLAALKSFQLLNWFDAKTDYLSERRQEAEFRAFNRFMKLFEKMLWMLSRMHGQSKITLEKINRLMHSMIIKAGYSLTERGNYGVQIMPRLEVLAVDCDVLFIGGLLEGEFPRTSSRDVFFNDDLRSKLGLAAAEEFLNRDRLSFYSLLNVAAKQTILCYPQYDDDRLLIPSTFVDELKDILPGKIETISIEPKYELTRNKLNQALGANIQTQDKKAAYQNIGTLLSFGVNRQNLNGALDKLLISRNRRLFIPPGIYEGYLSSETSINKILTRQTDKRPWSATLLDDYAYCPLSFLFKRIFKLQDLPDGGEYLTPLEKGLAVHKIFYKFYSELRSNERQHQPALYHRELLKIAHKVFDALPWNGFFGELEKQIFFGDESRPGLLETFIEDDQRQIEETGFVPSFFELAFGGAKRDESDPSSLKEAVLLSNEYGELKLVGSIDRVDVHEDGRILIIDYKTGDASTKINAKFFNRGTHYQLPLYALVIEKILNGASVYSGYYLIKSIDKCIRVPAMLDGENFGSKGKSSIAFLPNKKIIDEQGESLDYGQLIENSLRQALYQIDQLKQGNFMHTLYPTEDPCQKYCPFRRICRKNTAKQEYLKAQREEEKSS